MDREFDFIKAFADVNLLQVEAVGKVVGRTLGVLYLGMVEVGVKEDVAARIINEGWAEMVRVLFATQPKKPA